MTTVTYTINGCPTHSLCSHEDEEKRAGEQFQKIMGKDRGTQHVRKMRPMLLYHIPPQAYGGKAHNARARVCWDRQHVGRNTLRMEPMELDRIIDR